MFIYRYSYGNSFSEMWYCNNFWIHALFTLYHTFNNLSFLPTTVCHPATLNNISYTALSLSLITLLYRRHITINHNLWYMQETEVPQTQSIATALLSIHYWASVTKLLTINQKKGINSHLSGTLHIWEGNYMDVPLVNQTL